MTSKRLLLVAGSLGVVVVAALVWWVTRPAPAEVDISAALEAATASPTGPAVTSGSSAATSTDANPTAGPSTSADSTAPTSQGAALEAQVWTVSTTAVPYDFAGPTGTFVGFRIDEELSSVGSTTAVARTPGVAGELALDDTTVTTATFTADLTQLTSDRGQRNGAIQRALNTSAEPEATFELAEPVDIGEVPPVGEAVEAEVAGELTVNGTTVTDTFPLQAGRTAEDQLVVTGSFDVELADFGVQAPSAPVVVSVSDTATVEFQLYLER